MLRTGTPFAGIEEDGTNDGIYNVTEEQNTFKFNVCDRRQGDSTDYTANIKEEPHSPNMENISESFTCDRSDIKEEDSSDDINDMKDEGFSHNMDNIRENHTGNNIDCIEERDSQEAHIRESYNCDSIDIKVEDDISDNEGEDTRNNMDDIGEHFTWDNTDIKEEGVSQNMDELRKNYTCDSAEFKEQDSDVYMDGTNEDGTSISYNSDGLEQQEHDEATGAEKTGTYIYMQS